MATKPQSRIAVVEDNQPQENILDIIKSRQSSELVIALCGPLGCGIKQIIPILRGVLKTFHYRVEHVRISTLMQEAIKDQNNIKLSRLINELPTEESSNFDRYEKLQNLGNEIRKITNNTVLAKLAIQHIAVLRNDREPSVNINENHTSNNGDDDTAATVKTVYIINQLKHPDEAKLLSKVYGNIFYLIGVLSKEDERIARLHREEHIESHEAHNLIDRDRQEDVVYGQKLEKTLALADYFIRNRDDQTVSIKNLLTRFIELIHGKNGLTPTKDEKGMYAAYSAALESACLSRQVGAAICSQEGQVLAQGKNDVPKAGGGLYTPESMEKDHRCIHQGGKCYNDEYKNRLKKQIQTILQDHLKPDDSVKLSEKIVKNTQINSLIEYSRAIHAEMDAIVSLSRTTSSIPKNSVIYTTTYPCHNCARHIVAAGINRVVYIEPYEKSLAEKLHRDSISSSKEQDKVSFEPFEGVAPKRYLVFFLMTSPRKSPGNGQAIDSNPREVKTVDEEFIDSYTSRELRIVHHLEEAISKPEPEE